jgi:hypothetical protein
MNLLFNPYQCMCCMHNCKKDHMTKKDFLEVYDLIEKKVDEYDILAAMTLGVFESCQYRHLEEENDDPHQNFAYEFIEYCEFKDARDGAKEKAAKLFLEKKVRKAFFALLEMLRRVKTSMGWKMPLFTAEKLMSLLCIAEWQDDSPTITVAKDGGLWYLEDSKKPSSMWKSIFSLKEFFWDKFSEEQKFFLSACPANSIGYQMFLTANEFKDPVAKPKEEEVVEETFLTGMDELEEEDKDFWRTTLIDNGWCVSAEGELFKKRRVHVS